MAHLTGLNVRADRQHDRRALSVEELTLLHDAALNGPVRFNVTGVERALIYRLAVEMGLRAGEIRSLTRSSFDLGNEDEEPIVTVKAAYSTNRRESSILLCPQATALLADHLKLKTPEAAAFQMPPREHVAKMIRSDLDEARARWIKEAEEIPAEHERRTESDFLAHVDREKRVADFYALRHTFVSNLPAGGVHPKTARELARHSKWFQNLQNAGEMGPKRGF